MQMQPKCKRRLRTAPVHPEDFPRHGLAQSSSHSKRPPSTNSRERTSGIRPKNATCI